MDESNNCDVSPNDDNTEAFNADFSTSHEGGGDGGGKPTIEQKKQTSRNRNREHARCTRLRKKAFVTKLKELVDGLHAERNEDARKRRVAVQQLAEIQELRRKVVHTFLDYHCKFEGDYNKWSLILESGDGKGQEEFWLKQPVTPYRSFRRSEIQKVRLWWKLSVHRIVCGCPVFGGFTLCSLRLDLTSLVKLLMKQSYRYMSFFVLPLHPNQT
jgi:hypothetical protein